MEEKNNGKPTSRREFLQRSLLMGAGAMLTPSLLMGNSFVKDNISTSNFSSNSITSYARPAISSIDMQKRRLGTLEVSAVGMGCLPMVGYYGNGVREKAAMITLIRSAYESGIIFFDTAEVYGSYISEEYLAEAVAPFRDKIVIVPLLGFFCLSRPDKI